MTQQEQLGRPLRIDAARNRERIVEAAAADFAQLGLEVPLEDVARHAGVGIATLYRRFPTRDDLVAACFERRIAEYALAAEEALEAPDGWTGFCGYVERICAMQAADRGLTDVLTRTFPRAMKLEAHRKRGFKHLVRLIERAQAEGSLRADVTTEDVVLLLMANAGVVQGAGEAAPDAWRRFVGLYLDGFRSEGASEVPPPPSPRQVMRAMRRLSASPAAPRCKSATSVAGTPVAGTPAGGTGAPS